MKTNKIESSSRKLNITVLKRMASADGRRIPSGVDPPHLLGDTLINKLSKCEGKEIMLIDAANAEGAKSSIDKFIEYQKNTTPAIFYLIVVEKNENGFAVTEFDNVILIGGSGYVFGFVAALIGQNAPVSSSLYICSKDSIMSQLRACLQLFCAGMTTRNLYHLAPQHIAGLIEMIVPLEEQNVDALGRRTRPGQGYICKYCHQRGGDHNSHWHFHCPNKPSTSYPPTSVPAKGYICKYCKQEGGKPGAHWFIKCPTIAR